MSIIPIPIRIIERIVTFDILPEEKDEYIDVEVILVAVVRRSVIADEKSEVISSERIDSVSFSATGFRSELNGFDRKEIVQSDKEQIFLLYPISNKSSVTYFPNLSLEEAHDKGKGNIDNILVTVRFLEN